MMAGLLLSGWTPFDRTTWLLEVFPVMVVVPLLLLTRHHYPLTTLLYLAIFLHGIRPAVYAAVPDAADVCLKSGVGVALGFRHPALN